jgi:hypothetical protein
MPEKKGVGLRGMAEASVERWRKELGARQGGEVRDITTALGGVDGSPADGGCGRGRR